MEKKLLLFITIFITFGFSAYSQIDGIEEIVATYNGQSDKALYFTNIETNKIIEFKFVNKEVLSKYNLEDKTFIGKKIKLTYYVNYDKVEKKNSQPESITTKKRLTLFQIQVIDE